MTAETKKPRPPSAERLMQARRNSGFTAGRDAAISMGVPYGTYHTHENGARTITVQAAERYAAFFGVSPQYLLYGHGRNKPSKSRPPQVALLGTVGHYGKIETVQVNQLKQMPQAPKGRSHSALEPLLQLAQGHISGNDFATAMRSAITVQPGETVTALPHVDAPASVTSEARAVTMAAFRISTNDLIPLFFPGDEVFYTPTKGGTLHRRLSNRRCVVLSEDQQLYARVVMVDGDLRSVTMLATGAAPELTLHNPVGVWPITDIKMFDPDKAT
jgi:hypothetical protein